MAFGAELTQEAVETELAVEAYVVVMRLGLEQIATGPELNIKDILKMLGKEWAPNYGQIF